MSKKVRRYFLKEKETKKFLEETLRKLKLNLKQILKDKVKIEIVETEFAEIYLINGKPLLASSGEHVFPTLVFSEALALAPKIVVDMGAVPHVCNGANVMAPGIVRVEGYFKEDDFVLVVDERHGKPIAIGEALKNVEEVNKARKGVVVKNVHYVGDKVWRLIKRLKTIDTNLTVKS